MCLAAPLHLPYHIFTHVLQVFVSCRKWTELAKRQCGKCFLTYDGIILTVYLVNTAEWHKLAFDTDLSVA